MAAKTVLDIRDLTVSLPSGGDRLHAVKEANLLVEAGEILCVVGESGSGKSVMSLATMDLLPRGLTVESGRILFEGRDLVQLDARSRRAMTGQRMAMIFQESIPSLNPIYKVGKQVIEVFSLHTRLSRNEARQRVLSLFREVLLPEPEKIYDAYPHQLSGGQCQRVMIAMALALEPALLIADEPTTALDVTTQAQILRLIDDLRKKHGTAVIFITHDFGVVEEIADKVIVMQRGTVVETGTRAQILKAPQAEYTRQLIAAVPKLEPRAARASERPDVLDARNLKKQFLSRASKALDDVSITVRRGETVGLVGESGSGKSTLARSVIRLSNVDSGEILVANHDMGSANGKSLRRLRPYVQMVFQDPFSALDPRQNILSALIEGSIIHRRNTAEAHINAERLIEAVGLQKSALMRYPNEFSGGQRQRICIARALMLEPDLLIADEALSALDVTMQAQIIKLLTEMQDRLGFGMLFITHDLRVASSLCDRICVMQNGKIVEMAEPKDLFTSPKAAYTKQLLAAVPITDVGW